MATETYVYDGSKVTDLSKLVYGAGEGGATVSVVEAFKSVPWLYRAICLRADGVAGMPFDVMRGSEDVTGADEYKRLTSKLRTLLWMTEASLVTAGAAYWILNANQLGENLTPRFVLADTITPETDTLKGVTGFTRTIQANTIPIPLERMVYWWRPSLETEMGPGTPEAQVALAAAGVLLNADRMIENYFRRGAIKITLLTVEGNPSDDELRKLEGWWKRLISGVRKAYEAIAIRASVKPQVIGSDLKEADAGPLTDKKREDVAVALGVPQSLLFQSSAYATARHEDQLIFLERTVVPECQMIAEGLNEQWLGREGLTFTFHPERLGVMQESLLARANTVMTLTGQPVLSVDEGRTILGFEAGRSQADKDEADAVDGAAAEMRTWERFALKRFREGKPEKAREFKCQHISAARAAAIAGALEAAQSADEARRVFVWAGYP